MNRKKVQNTREILRKLQATSEGEDTTDPGLTNVKSEYVFSECIGLQTVSTDYAYEGMFSNCYSLTEVKFYGNEISPRAFQFCIKLQKISFLNPQSTISKIPKYCFYQCNNLFDINIPETIASIDDFAFFNTSLKNGIDLKNVQYIGEYSFSYSKLPSIKVSNKVYGDLEARIFDNCDELEQVIFVGEGSIPLGYLSNSQKFKTLTLSDKFTLKDGIVTKIDSEKGKTIVSYNIFTESTEVTIPSDVKAIENGAFCYSKYIKKLNIPNDVIINNYAFSYMESLEEVTINAKEIPQYCFYKSKKLSKVKLSNTEVISLFAFSYTNFTTLILPLTLKDIENAFLFSSVSLMVFESNKEHPDFIVTGKEVIQIDHDDNDEKNCCLFMENIKTKF